MAVQTPDSIRSEALMRLTDLHFNEAEAKLKYERARAIKTVEGRQALPGVASKMAELAQKQQQQKAKIAKQAEQQGVSQASLMPPMVDVTGQTSGRMGQGSFQSASEIFKQVSGGAGIKQGQGGGGGLLGNMMGAGQQAGTAAGNVALNQARLPQGAQQAGPNLPPGTTLQAGPPGATVPILQDMPWWQRAILVGGGLATKDIGAILAGAKGKQQVGSYTTPTKQEEEQRKFEEASHEAAPLAAAIRELKEKQGTPEAKEAGPRVSEMLRDIDKRRGRDVAAEAVRIATAKILGDEQEEREAMRRATTQSEVIAERQASAAQMRQRERQSQPAEQAKQKYAVFVDDLAKGKPSSSFGGETYTAAQRRAFMNEHVKATFKERIMADIEDRLSQSGQSQPQAAPQAAAPAFTQEQVDRAQDELIQQGKPADAQAIRRHLTGQ